MYFLFSFYSYYSMYYYEYTIPPSRTIARGYSCLHNLSYVSCRVLVFGPSAFRPDLKRDRSYISTNIHRLGREGKFMRGQLRPSAELSIYKHKPCLRGRVHHLDHANYAEQLRW